MEGGVGQKYDFQIPNFTVSANPSNPFDLFTLLSATAIPIVVEYAKITAAVNVANSVPLTWVIRTGAGSGGATSGATMVPEPGSGATASETLAYNVTTLGTLLRTLQADNWQQLGAVEYNRIPGGTLIVPGQAFCVAIPTGGVTANFSCSVAGTYYAMK